MTTSPSAADHAVMRRVNRAVVLDAIRSSETSSRASIAEATGLAKPTVGLIVDELLRADLVREVGRGSTGTGGGRPPVLLAFNARSSSLVGVHIGVRRTTVVVADALAEPIAQRTVETPAGRPEAALRSTVEVVRATLADAGTDASSLAAAGICLPGLVTDSGRLLLAPNLGWADVEVSTIVGGQLGCPVVAYNTTQSTLVAERAEGIARGADDVVLVYAGSGIGMAAVAGGVLLRGASGLAGELGHVPVVEGGAPCNCGRSGCLETVVSAEAVAERARTAWRAAGRRTPSVTASEVAAAAAEGDEAALSVLEEAGDALGVATAWLVNLLQPAVVVLAGGLAGAGGAFVQPFASSLRSHALAQSTERLRIEVSVLGQGAEVRGALLLAREHADSDLRIVTR